MDKGYYATLALLNALKVNVAIHNKNGQGLLLGKTSRKNILQVSQSTIKMDKGYYTYRGRWHGIVLAVAIHNKNGQGLLLVRL